jgi:hypothetical protein
MSKLRRLFTSALMVMVVLSMGAFASVENTSASAQAGDLIKMDGLSAVYYLGSDGKRYTFFDQSTYFSWYQDFSGVVTISATELQSYSLGGNVTMRPGTHLVKITTDPKVYAVEPGGELRWIQSEADAIALYGVDWASLVVDVNDSFFINTYTIADPLPSGEYPAGTLLKNVDGSSIYYWDGDDFRKFASEAAFVANGFNFDHVVETTGMTWSPLGDDITAYESMFNIDFNVDEAPGGTGLSVSLASDTPAAKTIPSNATGVEVAKYNFTASADGSVTIDGLTIKRTGVGLPSEVSKVYLYEGSTRLTNGRTISTSDNTATFSNVSYTVPAGSTKTISVVIDVANAATGNHAFGIESTSAVSTSAVVSGPFAITGNTMSFSSTPVGATDVEGSNTYTVKAGETNVEVGRFTVYVSSVEDGHLEGITLYNAGRDVVDNLKLYRGSDLIATANKSGNYFTFDLDTAYAISKGESAAFTVMGDVVGARDGDTATLNVRYNTDLKVKGQTYGYNLKPTIGTGTGSSMIDELGGTQVQTVNVEAGQVTLSFNGPVTSNVAKNSNDVVLMNFSITAQSTIDVEKVGVILRDSDADDDDDLTNAKIVCGSTVMNEWATWADVAATTVTDTSIWTVNAGETKHCKLTVDVENTKTASDTISADLDISNWTFKDVATGDTITDIIPSSDLVGNTMTVVEASLTGALAAIPASQTWVKGSSEIEVNGFNFTAGDAKDVKVTALTVDGYIDEQDDGTFTKSIDNTIDIKDVITSLMLYDGTTKIGDTKTFASNGEATFNTLDWTVPAGETKTLTVKATISSNAPYDVATANDRVKVAISTLTSEYDSGTGLTPDITAIDDEAEITVYQTITGAGTLTAQSASDTPKSDIIMMGTEEDITKIRFNATREDFIIEKLKVNKVGGADADVTSVILSYTNSDGDVETKTGSLSGGAVSFSSLDINVPKDGNTTVSIKANLNTSGSGATNSNSVQFDLVQATDFRAVGQSSGQVIADAGSAPAGNAMTLFEAKPTVTKATDSPEGKFTASGNTLVAKVDITASGKDITFENAVASNQIVFDFVQSGATASVNSTTVELRDSDGTVLCSDAAIDLDAGDSFTCDFATNALTVTAGTTETLSLYVDTTTAGLTSENDSIQVVLNDNANNNFIWSIDNNGADYATGAITLKGDIYFGNLSHN